MTKRLKHILEEAKDDRPFHHIVHDYLTKHHMPGKFEHEFAHWRAEEEFTTGASCYKSDRSGNHFQHSAMTKSGDHALKLEQHLASKGYKISDVKHHTGCVTVSEGEIPGKTKRYVASKGGEHHLVHHAVSTKPNEISDEHHLNEVVHTTDHDSLESVSHLRQGKSFTDWLHSPENSHHLDKLKGALDKVNKTN